MIIPGVTEHPTLRRALRWVGLALYLGHLGGSLKPIEEDQDQDQDERAEA